MTADDTIDNATPEDLTARVSASIEARRDRFIALADAIWDHPETRFEEHVSSRLLAVVAQGRSALGHKGMLRAAEVLGSTAVRLLEDPECLRRARRELREANERTPYTCPIPPGVTPSPLAC